MSLNGIEVPIERRHKAETHGAGVGVASFSAFPVTHLGNLGFFSLKLQVGLEVLVSREGNTSTTGWQEFKTLSYGYCLATWGSLC